MKITSAETARVVIPGVAPPLDARLARRRASAIRLREKDLVLPHADTRGADLDFARRRREIVAANGRVGPVGSPVGTAGE